MSKHPGSPYVSGRTRIAEAPRSAEGLGRPAAVTTRRATVVSCPTDQCSAIAGSRAAGRHHPTVGQQT